MGSISPTNASPEMHAIYSPNSSHLTLFKALLETESNRYVLDADTGDMYWVDYNSGQEITIKFVHRFNNMPTIRLPFAPLPGKDTILLKDFLRNKEKNVTFTKSDETYYKLELDKTEEVKAILVHKRESSSSSSDSKPSDSSSCNFFAIGVLLTITIAGIALKIFTSSLEQGEL